MTHTLSRLRLRRFAAPSALLVLLALSACAGKEEAAPGGMPDSMKNMGAGDEAGGGAPFATGSAMVGTIGPVAVHNGREVRSVRAELDPGVVVPDGMGGVVLMPGAPRKAPDPNFVDARELKLKVREMAEQLVSGLQDPSLRNSVALPVSFVNLNNFEETSGFGRLVAEQLFYEFNQRGFPVREYRIPDNISVRPQEGEFYLSRAIGDIAAQHPGSVVVAGTYYADKQAIFVNARLIRPSDGRVMRSANLVLEANGLTRRMVGNTGGKKFEAGAAASGMRIRNLRDTTAPGDITPFDRGEDVH